MFSTQANAQSAMSNPNGTRPSPFPPNFAAQHASGPSALNGPPPGSQHPDRTLLHLLVLSGMPTAEAAEQLHRMSPTRKTTLLRSLLAKLQARQLSDGFPGASSLSSSGAGPLGAPLPQPDFAEAAAQYELDHERGGPPCGTPPKLRRLGSGSADVSVGRATPNARMHPIEVAPQA